MLYTKVNDIPYQVLVEDGFKGGDFYEYLHRQQCIDIINSVPFAELKKLFNFSTKMTPDSRVQLKTTIDIKDTI